MSKVLHGALQLLGVAVQVTNLSTSIVPPKYQALVAGLVAVAQAALALTNHPTTPSGGASVQGSK
jgi:hypothetical protein